MATTRETEGLKVRLSGLVRSISLSGLAGAVAGLVVLGIGGRLVMFASRLLHPEASGRLTENGQRIGEFTIDGTIAVIIFGGLFSGILGGIVWVSVRQWIPKSAALVGLGAVAIGGGVLIEADNPDFVILEGPQLDLVLLLGLVFLFGATLYWLDGLLDRRVPDPPGKLGTIIYALIVIQGATFLFGPPVKDVFYQCSFCSNPLLWTGGFLAATLLATLVWWVQHLRGADTPSKALTAAGRLSVTAAVLAGGIHLARELIQIL